MASVDDRFWSKVSVGDGCWLWMASRNDDGYGQFKLNGKVKKAHVVSWSVIAGRPIPGGHGVLHKCDIRPCVRLSHLFTGTHQDNMVDRSAKGRWRGGDLRGEDHGASKLTDDQVLEIRSRCSAGETQISVAERFGIAQSNVSQIINFKQWKHLRQE